jgi:uncharacterized ion transporter superfamily protein YfcC
MTRVRVPHTLVLLFAMVALAQLATYVLPAGTFERVTPEDAQHAGHEQVVPGSYHRLPDAPRLPWWSLFTAVPKGLAGAQEIVFFIFLVGGAFGVLRATGAVDAGIGKLLEKLGGYPSLLIGGAMAAFAVGSATIGMAEEYIPFVPVLVALCLGLGFDRMTGVGTLCVGYGVGYGAALLNPFTVLVAQDIAGLPPASGLGYRGVLLGVFFVIGFHHVWSYARRVAADPARSLVADVAAEGAAVPDSYPRLSGAHVVVLGLLAVALAVLVYGIKAWGWYLVEMGGYFVALSILLGALARLSPDRLAKAFCTGAAEMTTTALLVGVARGIQVLLVEGQVVDTVIHGIALPLQQLPAALSAVGMLIVQSLTNLFIPSGSGQAYAVMPIMAPLSDLVGVSRQAAVLAYQFGDGFTNILVPTNAVLIGILAMAGIPFDRWLRFVVPFMLKIWVVAAMAMVVAVWIGY